MKQPIMCPLLLRLQVLSEPLALPHDVSLRTQTHKKYLNTAVDHVYARPLFPL